MSVLIKGMEMPKTCEECDLCTSDGYCIATGGDSLWDALPEGAEYFPTGWKYEGCPLVEVPAPHGRLIDADALIAQMTSDAEQMEEPLAKMFTYAAINDVKHSESVIKEEDGDAE